MKPIKRVRSTHEMKPSGLRHSPGKVMALILRSMLLVLLLAIVAGCSADQTTDPSDPSPGTPGDTTPGTQDPAPSPDTIQQYWQASSHADTFVLDNVGENNACARCHSPVNFMPTMDDIADACLACKFEIEDPIPLILEQDWEQIPCIVCHEPDGDTVEPEIAWLEIPQIESYADVSSANELCLKCHSGENIDQHVFPELGGAHAAYQCIDCHEAHAITASCDVEGCHADADPSLEIAGHDDDHQNVACWACHDGSGMDVGPEQDLGIWTTLHPGADAGQALVSHDIVREAICGRCHFANNPWNLSAEVTQP